MPKQERVEKKSTSRAREEVPAAEVKKADTEDLKAGLDDILDEIDSVLEENAETFVRDFVQKGGQVHGGFGPHEGGQWCRFGTWNQAFDVPSARRSFRLLDI